MKSEHRHELETNVLAKHLETWVEQARPYMGTVAGILIAVVVAVFGWTIYSNSSSAQQTEAWNAYNSAIESVMPNLEELRKSSEEYPGTKVKELADITWADGQVWMASREYIHVRSGAMEALDRARSAYESVIRSSSDERLVNRARFGIARIYEMQNDLEKAREEYLKVQGGFEELAKQRAEELEKEETREAYDWLAQAKPPRQPALMGPGTPGQLPAFSAGDFQLPGGTPAGTAPGSSGTGEGPALESLFQGLDAESDAPATDRYEAGENPPAADEAGAASESTEPAPPRE